MEMHVPWRSQFRENEYLMSFPPDKAVEMFTLALQNCYLECTNSRAAQRALIVRRFYTRVLSKLINCLFNLAREGKAAQLSRYKHPVLPNTFEHLLLQLQNQPPVESVFCTTESALQQVM